MLKYIHMARDNVRGFSVPEKRHANLPEIQEGHARKEAGCPRVLNLGLQNKNV